MNSMVFATNLIKLHEQYAQAYQKEHGTLPCMYYDKAWPSSCEVGDPLNDEQIQWQAVAQPAENSLFDLANALECTFLDELNAFYSTVYAGNIVANVEGHQIELLQAWNEDDYVRLQQNITGHVLMKRKLKQDDSVFIGLTEQDDLLITVLLGSGEVCLEYVGKPPHHVLAANLAEFINSLTF